MGQHYGLIAMTWSRAARLTASVVIALTSIPLFGAASATSQSPASPPASVKASQDGWWNRFQGPQDGEPGNPLRPVLPALRPPTVPESAFAVGASGGSEDKVAAIAIDLTTPEAPTVNRLTLKLKEARANGSNVNSGSATIVACPISESWGPAKNGNWVDRPKADCALGKVAGARGADGTWTFELAPIATLWVPPGASVEPNGVLLTVGTVGAGQPSPAFQVSWDDIANGGVTVAIEATSGPVSEAQPAAPAEPQPAPSSAPSAEATPDVGATASPAPSADASPAPVAPLAEAPLPDAPTAEPTASAAPRPVSRIGDLIGNVPPITFLLVPLALGLGLLLAFVMGPAGEPRTILRRQGGVAAALSRRDVAPRPQPTT
jgi:hypothetical protein